MPDDMMASWPWAARVEPPDTGESTSFRQIQLILGALR